MKKRQRRRPNPLLETFMDEYSGRADARRVKEAAKKKPKKMTVVETRTRSVVPSMSTYRVQALKQENHALRLQLAAQQNMNTQAIADGIANAFEQEYNRPDHEPEEQPRGRKIVLDPK